MDPGSELFLDASNVADPDQFLMNIGDISMAEGSFITLIPNTSEDINKLINFGEGVDLSQLQFGDAGGYVFQVMGNELWALGGNAIPEPSTWALLLIGTVSLGALPGPVTAVPNSYEGRDIYIDLTDSQTLGDVSLFRAAYRAPTLSGAASAVRVIPTLSGGANTSP